MHKCISNWFYRQFYGPIHSVLCASEILDALYVRLCRWKINFCAFFNWNSQLHSMLMFTLLLLRFHDVFGFFICFCCYWKSDYASCIKIISLQSMWCLVSFSSIIEHFLNASILVCWSFCLNNNKPFCFKYKINISKQFVSHFSRIWRFYVQKIETIQRLRNFPLHIFVVGYLASRI